MSFVKKHHVLCVIPTKGRYLTTLPLAISAVANQTVKPDELVIFDDSDQVVDLRTIPVFLNLFRLLDFHKIAWKVLFGKRMGQHFSHQAAQDMSKEIVWRIDDDNIPAPNVLEILLSNLEPDVGAVGGLVLSSDACYNECHNNPIYDVSDNCQWYRWYGKKLVQHLYSSFIYRRGLADYELSLSKACHREETIFSHRIYRRGFKLIVDSDVVTFHMRNSEGGIRPYGKEMFEHDERIFQEIKREWSGDIICYLDNGKGDHVVFRHILPMIKMKYKRVRIACCYPEIFEGEEVMSLEDGKKLVTPDRFNIYKFMSDRNWNSEMENAFKRMYLSL